MLSDLTGRRPTLKAVTRGGLLTVGLVLGLGLSYGLLLRYGIVGVGWAWLVSQTAVAIFIIVTQFRSLFGTSSVTMPMHNAHHNQG